MTIDHVLSTVLHSRGARTFIYQSLTAAALIVGAAGMAEAQPQRPAPSVQRVQGTPPAEGARGWNSQDNCFYIYQSGGWRRQDWCRVMRGANLYDTYTPSNRRWGVRIDESKPGWTGTLDLNGGDPNSWLYFSNDGRTILAFKNGQWFNYSAAVAAQNRPATGGNTAVYGNPAAILGGGPAIIPGSGGAILGGGTSTPNPNPMTVDSLAAERAKATMSPASQAAYAEAQRAIAASQARGVSVWTAPNCTASYNGCR